MTGYLDAKQAAAYVGVSLRHFEETVAPFVPAADLRSPGASRPCLRWDVRDVDAFMASKKQVRVA